MLRYKPHTRSPIPNKLEVPGKKDKVLKPWTTTSTSALALVVLLEGLTQKRKKSSPGLDEDKELKFGENLNNQQMVEEVD